MSHAKYQALADQITQRRIKHLQKVRKPLPATEQRRPDPSQISQLALFSPASPSVEIFKEFDAKNRAVEWSYYSADGTFLLQFGFSLEEHGYQIYSVHAALFQKQANMKEYLRLINEDLQAHYPSLQLQNSSSEGPSLVLAAQVEKTSVAQ